MHERTTVISPYTYITLRKGKVARTMEVGPKEMWYDANGQGVGPGVVPQVLIDVDESGMVLGIEILEPGKMCGCWDTTEEGGNG